MCSVELLPHNQKAYSKIRQAIQNGKKRIAVSHATGTGKSYLIAKLFEDYKTDRKLIIVPSLYIKENLEKLFSKYNIKNVDILLYQRLINMLDEEIQMLDYKIIVLDEYHHTTSKVWGEKVNALIRSHGESIVFGTSATPIRMDGVNTIDEVFEGNCISELPLSEAIAERIVPIPKYIAALYTLDYEFEALRKKIQNSRNSDEEKKEFYKKINAMRAQIEKSYGMPIILNNHIENRTGKYIVFCKNKKHLEEIKDTVIEWFNVAGIKKIHSYTVYSSYTAKDKEFNAFCTDNTNNMKLLFCINMLNEGLHLENITGVLLLRPTNSHIVFNQQLGRVIETSNSEQPIIFDAVNNFSSAGNGIKLFESIKDTLSKKNTSEKGDEEKVCMNVDTFFVTEYVKDVKKLFDDVESKIKAHSTPWEKWEIEILKEKYPIQGTNIEELKHRSKHCIVQKATRLGFFFRKPWEDWEVKILKEKYTKQGSDIEELKHRSKKRIGEKARELGLSFTPTKPKPWEDWEIAILKEKYPMQCRNITELNHRSKKQIGEKARKLGLFNKKAWEDWEIDVLKEKFPVQGPNIKELMHRSRGGIIYKASSLGVYKLTRST